MAAAVAQLSVDPLSKASPEELDVGDENVPPESAQSVDAAAAGGTEEESEPAKKEDETTTASEPAPPASEETEQTDETTEESKADDTPEAAPPAEGEAPADATPPDAATDEKDSTTPDTPDPADAEAEAAAAAAAAAAAVPVKEVVEAAGQPSGGETAPTIPFISKDNTAEQVAGAYARLTTDSGEEAEEPTAVASVSNQAVLADESQEPAADDTTKPKHNPMEQPCCLIL